MFLVLSLLCGAGGAALAAEEPLQITAVFALADEARDDIRLLPQTVGGENLLFLPSYMEPTAAIVHVSVNAEADVTVSGACGSAEAVSGAPLDLPALCGEGDVYRVTFTAATASETVQYAVVLVPTCGAASLYLVSDDPAEHGRAWVESSPDKSNKATGSMLMTDADGTPVYDGALTQIKGRGNSTWLEEKKPYQIKLKTKTDLLQTGDKANAAKTWVLLTNASDASLLRNNIVYDLSVAMNIEPGIECRPVNLYYDGEYRGAYLLCEKVEIKRGRVDITDLEESIEDANPDVDMDSLPVRVGTTVNGATYRYCEGLNTPADISGGYLLEMETPARVDSEICYFTTVRGQCIVVKSPEYCSAAVMAYIASWYQDFEDTVYHGGVHPTNGKTLADYADVESLAQCYIINELTKNPDGYRTSAYLYKDAGSDVCRMGPIWDYDLSFGVGWGTFVENCADPEGFFTLRSKFGMALYDIPAFRRAVHDIYLDTVAPLITDVLCAEADVQTAALQSLPAYMNELRATANANALVWGSSLAAWQQNIEAMRTYILTRNEWLTAQYAAWNAETDAPLLGYEDVYITDWYYDDIIRATQCGILNGMDFGVFAPLQNATRAEATKVLYAVAGGESYAYEPIFPDVLSYHWFVSPVLWAVKNGVVTGHEDGTFRPDDPITREEFVTLLYRYVIKTGSAAIEDTPTDGAPTETDALAAFADAESISPYAVAAMRWAVENGILKGYDDATLRPTATMTRAELAAIILRFHDHLPTT